MLPEDGEYLTTGWEADLDPADSVLRQAVLAHVSWAHVLAGGSDGRSIDQAGWAAGYGRHPSPLLNVVVLKQPPDDWRRLLEEVDAFLPRGVPAAVLSPFPTPDLAGLGLALLGHPPLMMRPTATQAVAPQTSLDVRRATTPTELEDAERVFIEGYPLPELDGLPRGTFYRPEFGGRATHLYVAYDGQAAVATSAAHSAAGVTVVENVAVLGQARGRGAGAAVTWAATTAWPEQPAVLLASDEGQPVYARLGYLRMLRWTAWLRP